MPPPLASIGLAILAGLTSGCIAAAVPLAAGATLMRSQTPRDGSSDTPLRPVAAASARSDFKVVRTSLTALPPPDLRAQPGNAAVPAFLRYALAQADAPIRAGKRSSAILTAASDLRPMRSVCEALPPAVLIDLDPGRGTFDPLVAGRPDPALVPALATLRERGVRIVWFSRLGSNFAAATRGALGESGLDPSGADELVLMPDIAERKQSLRDAVAARFCPIAMLGDERADFDELYLYLKKPDAAIALDSMIGKGWFLAHPFALSPEAGATP